MSWPFPQGQTVYRDRRKLVPDPYNPDRLTPGPWDEVDTISIFDAFLASNGSSAIPDPTRSQVLTSRTLFCGPGHDVVVGDRIRTEAGEIFDVQALPASDRNPWTGWQPVKVVNLVEVSG
jgi:hypothetical protein